MLTNLFDKLVQEVPDDLAKAEFGRPNEPLLLLSPAVIEGIRGVDENQKTPDVEYLDLLEESFGALIRLLPNVVEVTRK